MTYPRPTDEQIKDSVKRAQQGDEDAFAFLYETYLDVIYRYIYYRVPSAADAEDLTGEVFLNMVKRLPGYRFTEAPFEAWLYRIAALRIADFYRRSKRRPQVELTESLSDNTLLPEEQVQQLQESEALQQALEQLTEEQQTILFLRFRERKSHEEVAHILGKTVDAVRSTQHRTLSRLAMLLGSGGKARHYLRGNDD
jgi:RNA polymerase sigma-70 factor (ECF subfamily)